VQMAVALANGFTWPRAGRSELLQTPTETPRQLEPESPESDESFDGVTRVLFPPTPGSSRVQSPLHSSPASPRTTGGCQLFDASWGRTACRCFRITGSLFVATAVMAPGVLVARASMDSLLHAGNNAALLRGATPSGVKLEWRRRAEELVEGSRRRGAWAARAWLQACQWPPRVAGVDPCGLQRTSSAPARLLAETMADSVGTLGQREQHGGENLGSPPLARSLGSRNIENLSSPPRSGQYEGGNPGSRPDSRHYASENPLAIRASTRRRENFFIVAGGSGLCQAETMRRYVEVQRRADRSLLFIATVGNELGSELWSQDDLLHHVPWLAAPGNHGYADCQPLRLLAQQLSSGPKRLWLPDHNYHYSIPEADLEVIALDTNMESTRLCAGFLRTIRAAGHELLVQRAQRGSARTVLILQHFPGRCRRDVFEAAVPAGREVRVLCAYGHHGVLRCEGHDAAGTCDMVMAGDCCPTTANASGFAAVHLTADGGFVTVLEPGNCT